MPGFKVKGADGRAGHLRQLDRTHLGAVDGSARTVGGKDGRLAAFDHLRKAQQLLARAAAAGAAHGMEAEGRMRVINSPSKLWLTRMVAPVRR